MFIIHLVCLCLWLCGRQAGAEARLSQYYECLVVGALNLVALQFQSLARLLEACVPPDAAPAVAVAPSASETTSAAGVELAGSRSGGDGAAGAGPGSEQQQQQQEAQTQTQAQVRQLVSDPKFHSLLANYANLLFALGARTLATPRPAPPRNSPIPRTRSVYCIRTCPHSTVLYPECVLPTRH